MSDQDFVEQKLAENLDKLKSIVNQFLNQEWADKFVLAFDNKEYKICWEILNDAWFYFM